MYVKLLNYIIESDDNDEKNWAYRKLAPRLLRRFISGKRAQHIDPFYAVKEAAVLSCETLKVRIRDEAIIPDDELLSESFYDYYILYCVDKLMRQIQQDLYTPLDFKDLTSNRVQVIEESIVELEHPRKYTIFRNFGLQEENRPFILYLSDRPPIETKPKTVQPVKGVARAIHKRYRVTNTIHRLTSNRYRLYFSFQTGVRLLRKASIPSLASSVTQRDANISLEYCSALSNSISAV